MHFGRICKNSSKPIHDLKLRSNISYNNVHVVQDVQESRIKYYQTIHEHQTFYYQNIKIKNQITFT